jgi:hypothetical protein
MLKVWICGLALAAVTVSAQQPTWDVGVIGGAGFSDGLSVKNGSGSASAGFATGAVYGLYAGEDTYRYLSGEVNFLYRQSNLRLSGDGVTESLAAHTHLITGDVLWHFTPRGSRIRPFISGGAGVRDIVATGNEGAPQPLGETCYSPNPMCFAALTATREDQFVGEVGAGVKIQLSRLFRLRLQVRDFLGPQPSKVIAPGPGANMNGLLNDIVATASLGFTW